MHRFTHGFTLIELLIVIAIMTIVMSLAVPAFTDQLARRRLEGAANELSADLQFSRTEAISKNRQVALVSDADGDTYTINYVGAITPALKTVNLPVTITVSSGITVTYDPLRGMATSSTNLTLSSSQLSGTLRVAVDNVGRIRLCSPGGIFMGYTECV